jgi:hypothetical protein
VSGNAIGGNEATSQASRRRRDANGVSSSPLGQDSRVRSQTVRLFLFMKNWEFRSDLCGLG